MREDVTGNDEMRESETLMHIVLFCSALVVPHVFF